MGGFYCAGGRTSNRRGRDENRRSKQVSELCFFWRPVRKNGPFCLERGQVGAVLSPSPTVCPEKSPLRNVGRILTLPPERRSPTRQVFKSAPKRAGSETGAPRCPVESGAVSRCAPQCRSNYLAL